MFLQQFGGINHQYELFIPKIYKNGTTQNNNGQSYYYQVMDYYQYSLVDYFEHWDSLRYKSRKYESRSDNQNIQNIVEFSKAIQSQINLDDLRQLKIAQTQARKLLEKMHDIVIDLKELLMEKSPLMKSFDHCKSAQQLIVEGKINELSQVEGTSPSVVTRHNNGEDNNRSD
ncbi:UNKNOWN [Stylonychia lemnae]|uniref:Uncharacterized protein n=1 Tax=Stylonychia lemnae TaxID=5949 RepID=A0A078A7U9_STYLE|nr:UNKNOWN [Stylonychia lemnae]|eukprot:CDW77916.1 UNKNOWN [Stylonychia lemnae]